MRTTLLLTVAAGLVASPLFAHDFWLQPEAFWARRGERVSIAMLVGHGAARERSAIAPSRITLFRSIGPSGAANRLGELSQGGTADPALAFPLPGTYLVCLSTNNVSSDLPAKRFNEYASAEGLTQVLAQRAASGAMNKPGRELYSRRAKAIVQIGLPGNAPQPHVTRPVGLGLEIVPLINPYARNTAPAMTVQVLYQGRPLPGALVKLNNLADDAQPVEMHRTDAAGRAVFRARRTGQWQFNVVWGQSLSNNPSADFLTTFSSLTFGFPASRPAR